MNKFFFYTFLLCFLSFFFYKKFIFYNNSNYEEFSKIPVLHEGRVKPLMNIAKIAYSMINGKNYIENFTEIELLAELLFNKEKAYSKKIFFLKYHDFLKNTNLKRDIQNRYSFNDLLPYIIENLNLIQLVEQKSFYKRSVEENCFLNIYYKLLLFERLSSVIDIFLLNFTLDGINSFSEKEFSKYDVFNKTEFLFKQIQNNNFFFKSLINKKVYFFYLIPISDVEWLNLSDILSKNLEIDYKIFNLINDMSFLYSSGKYDEWNLACGKFKKMSYKKISISLKKSLILELFYNKVAPLNISFALYVFSFFIGVFIWFFFSKNHYLFKINVYVFLFGFIFHFLGLILRILITNKPPITSLYESILFVNLIFTFTILYLFFLQKFHLILFAGSLCSMLLQYVVYEYDLSGDNIKILVSILDTNFWLIVHVITISIGYGLCLIFGVLGHIYLFSYWMYSKNKLFLSFLSKKMFIICLLALFFSFFGTILGGIWADQSWGRFWGWDPKENGAMLIVLWLIFILHLRFTKLFSYVLFSIGAIVCNMLVFLVWFGVNLLNVGLHSYGFIQDMGKFLFLFCFLEFLYVLFFIFLVYNINFVKRLKILKNNFFML